MRLEANSIVPFVSLAAQVGINFSGRTPAETFQGENLFETHYLLCWPFFLDNRHGDDRSRIDFPAQILGKLRRGIVFLDNPVHGSPLLANSTTTLAKRLARIEGVAHGFADEDQQRQHDRYREEA